MALYRTQVVDAADAPVVISSIVLHAEPFGCILLSASFADGRYVLNLHPPMPEDQLGHLGLEEI